MAGNQAIRPGARNGELGTTKYVASAAAAVMIIGSQNSQWKPSAVTMGPASTVPTPAPAAPSVAIVPTAPETLRRKLVTHDSEREREHPPADTLDDPTDDHQANVGGERGQQRA
jgi:hypothetical protein